MNEYHFRGTRKGDGAPIESRMRARNEDELRSNLADYGIVFESAQLLSSPNRTQTVSLGCGTLALIAIIVMMFSRHDYDDVERRLRQLQSDVKHLEAAIEAQTQMLEELRADR